MNKTVNALVAFTFDELHNAMRGNPFGGEGCEVMEKAKREGKEDAFMDALNILLVGEYRSITNIDWIITHHAYELI